MLVFITQITKTKTSSPYLQTRKPVAFADQNALYFENFNIISQEIVKILQTNNLQVLWNDKLYNMLKNYFVSITQIRKQNK